MISSGHTVQQARRNVLSGVKGYESRLKQCAKNNTPINMSATGCDASRRKKKLTGKTDWFRKPSEPSDPPPDDDLPNNISNGEGGGSPPNKSRKNKSPSPNAECQDRTQEPVIVGSILSSYTPT